MKEIINYINGEWQSASNSRVSFSDGGFQRGDGLFETIRFQNGRLFKPEKHLKRLHSGLNIIQIEFHKSNTEIISILEEMIKQNHISSGFPYNSRGFLLFLPWLPLILVSLRRYDFV